ncbi:MAG: hypothetical protein DMG58_30310 [Acidobacteria bacterium]|nr:MAG: hypothetical protein DMG58_30310 [Acidobacteriota bacterium]
MSLLSPADLLAAVGADGSVKIWDLQTGALTHRPPGPSRKVRGLAFSNDRRLVAAGSHTFDTGSEDTVRLWDTTGKELFAAPAGLGGTSAMAISPDGGTLVAASYDTNVRAWSTRNGELLRLIEELVASGQIPEADSFLRVRRGRQPPIRRKAGSCRASCPGRWR